MNCNICVIKVLSNVEGCETATQIYVLLSAGIRKNSGNKIQLTAQQKTDVGSAFTMYVLCQGFQFARLLPSDLLTPGSCRRGFLDGTTSYAKAGERTELKGAFRQDGCHTCGVYPSCLVVLRKNIHWGGSSVM